MLTTLTTTINKVTTENMKNLLQSIGLSTDNLTVEEINQRGLVYEKTLAEISSSSTMESDAVKGKVVASMHGLKFRDVNKNITVDTTGLTVREVVTGIESIMKEIGSLISRGYLNHSNL